MQLYRSSASSVLQGSTTRLRRTIRSIPRSFHTAHNRDDKDSSVTTTTTMAAQAQTAQIRILETSSADGDPRRRKQFVTTLDPAYPNGWTREACHHSVAAAAVDKSNDTASSSSRTWSDLLYDNGLKHFLPAQYPHSVANGYSSYALYSFGASIAGSAAMVLSTQTLLLAVGVVGSGQASVLAGAFNWILKDGVGQLGGVLYASFLGRTRRFDANPKRWRVMAAICLDLGTLLEILSPYAATQSSGSLVLPLACVANVLKNMGFLTASASRASLHQAMAIKGNLGDVTAKAGSQATVAGLGGTSVGIGISTFLSASANIETFVMAFCVLSMLHQVGNYLSVQSVPLSHFNGQRLHILLDHYCSKMDTKAENPFPCQKVLSPQDVAARESFLPWMSDSQSQPDWLVIGPKLSSLAPKGASELRLLVDSFSEESYLVNLLEDRSVLLTFSAHAIGEDIIQGMLHAYVLRHAGNRWTNEEAVHESLRLVKSEMPSFIEELQTKGWRLGAESFIIEPSEAIRYSLD